MWFMLFRREKNNRGSKNVKDYPPCTVDLALLLESLYLLYILVLFQRAVVKVFGLLVEQKEFTFFSPC